MTTQQLKVRLLVIANQGLSTANQGNPFWTKSQAMQAINNSRLISK
jgi:hypothetical protein